MTVPRLKPAKSSWLNDVFLFFAASATFLGVFSMIGPFLIHRHDDTASSQQQLLRVPAPSNKQQQQQQEVPVEVDVEDLEHEDRFQKTVKSCIPWQTNRCKQFVVPELQHQRIALLAPPGAISDSLRRRIERIVDHHNQQATTSTKNIKNVTTPASVDQLPIDLIVTSHVPPYGYGKTHGYTKVIRLVPQPVVLEATDALLALAPMEDISWRDVTAAVRQVVRFHCRLSHLAAHTSLLSVPYEDVLMQPEDLMGTLRRFLTGKLATANTDDESPHALTDDDGNRLFEAQEQYGTQLLSYLQAQHQNMQVNAELDKVLMDELETTKNLSKWPCQSFWTVSDQLSPLTQKLAAALSPNCQDPLANCWVKRDKCEAAGDGICDGK